MTYHTFTPSADNPLRCYECGLLQKTHKTFIGKDQEVRISELDEEKEAEDYERSMTNYWEL